MSTLYSTHGRDTKRLRQTQPSLDNVEFHQVPFEKSSVGLLTVPLPGHISYYSTCHWGGSSLPPIARCNLSIRSFVIPFNPSCDLLCAMGKQKARPQGSSEHCTATTRLIRPWCRIFKMALKEELSSLLAVIPLRMLKSRSHSKVAV